MAEALDLKNVVEEIISSYEARIQALSSIFDANHLLVDEFQKSLLDNKEERGKINTQLRDTLAKNEHLRKKDFDNMMQSILQTQDQREKEVRNLLKDYFSRQKSVGRALRENLEKFKNSLIKGEPQRIKEFQREIKEIRAKQDERKDEVTSGLKEFQKEQQEMMKRLNELLTKGRELRIKDLKSMLEKFNGQYKKRIACQAERREEVHNMLGKFKKNRLKAAKKWRTVRSKLLQGRIKIPEAIKLDASKQGEEKNKRRKKMAIANDIKKLGDNIIASYDTRVKAIGELISNTHKTLNSFAVDRKKMSKEQARALTDFVADLTKNVGHMITGFQKDHKAMANDLKGNLKKGEADRTKAFKDMMANIQKDIKDIETYIKNKLKEFSEAHSNMSEELKKDLAKYVTDIANSVKNLLGEYRSDIGQAKEAWMSMSSVMAKSKTGDIMSRVEAGENVTTVEETLKIKSKGNAGKKRRKKKK